MSNSTKILVVDDEPIGRQLLEAILVPEGYDISFGADGEEAIKVAVNELPDIILLDVMMPKMDGFEVCKKLRENDSTAHIPIYLITALDDRDSRIRGIDAGAYDYISKPFDRVEILAKIKNITNQLKILKKNSPARDEIKKQDKSSNIDVQLIDALAQSMLNYPDSENLHIYHSNPVTDSAHACIRKKTQSGRYTLIMSNKLQSGNAVLSNCIFSAIIIQKIEEFDGQLKKILRESYTGLNNIIEKNKETSLNKAGFALIILLEKSETREIVLTGLNQHVFILENNQLIAQAQGPAYNMYYLQGNQELRFEETKEIMAFAPDINEALNQQKLLDILNEALRNNSSIDTEQLAKNKLNSIPDLFVFKLSLG